jgi:hypothetical protein
MRRVFFIALILVAGSNAWGQRGYNRHTLQVKNELGAIVTDVTSIQVCTTSTTSAQTIYQDELLSTAVTNPITTSSDNTTLVQASGTCYWYGTDAYDVTIVSTTYGTIHYKGMSAGIGTVIFPTYWVASQSQTTTDAQSISMGTDADWVLVAGATANRFTATPAADGAVFWVGSDSVQADFKWWAGTGTSYANFSQSGSEIDWVGLVTEWADDSFAKFGTDADWSIYSSTAKQLDIVPTVTDESPILNIGASGTGAVVNMYATTAGDYMKWDPVTETLQFNDTGIALGDSDPILLGDTIGTGDFKISDESDVLTFAQIVADTGTVAWGADNAGIDQLWYGESASAYMKYDATSADQLILVGVDSSGTLLAITSADTTGDSDTVTISHNSGGDGIQITDVATDGTAFHAIAAANQTTAIVNVDGSTGNYIGADNVGALTVSGDTAGTHAGTSLVVVSNTAQPIAAAEGFLARFIDTGTARTDAYAVEIETTNTTPALKLNNQMTITGADSGGVLFDITGIDTSGNSDTAQIAHSGTGDGLQITCSTATAVAENLVAAASQTTSVLKVDGATGSWIGATGVGMVNLTNDGALAHTAASLLYINNTGVPQNDSRGSSLRIVDTGNAAAGTAGYAAYISATDATVEALYVDDGDVLVDEDMIVKGNVLNPATAGTKVYSGSPITIEFRPTAAETLTWAVPDGFDLVITDAWGYKIAANGSHADDDIQLQNNDGSAADIFTEEELTGVNDTLRFQFDGLLDTQNEVEDTSTLDCVANEGGSVDCIVIVTGYLKTAD